MAASLSHLFKHSLVKNSGLFLVGNLVNKAIPFFMLPVMAHHLSPESYGQVASFIAAAGFFTPFVGLSIQSAFAVGYVKLGPQEFKAHVFNRFCLTTGGFLVATLFVFLAVDRLQKLLLIDPKWIYAVVFYCYCTAIADGYINILRAAKQVKKYLTFEIIRTLSNFCLSGLLVVALAWDYPGRLWGIIGSASVMALAALGILVRSQALEFRLDPRILREQLAFGAALIPHVLSGWIIVACDRLFLNTYQGLASSGVYTVGHQLASILQILSLTFNFAWMAFFYQALQDNNPQRNRKIVKFTYLYFLGITLAAVAFSQLAPWLLRWMASDEYSGAADVIFWLALGHAFGGMQMMVCGYLLFCGKNQWLSAASLLGAAVTLLLNYRLVPEYGGVGAAQAALLGNVTVFVFTWIFSAIFYPFPWRFWRSSSPPPLAPPPAQ